MHRAKCRSNPQLKSKQNIFIHIETQKPQSLNLTPWNQNCLWSISITAGWKRQRKRSREEVPNDKKLAVNCSCLIANMRNREGSAVELSFKAPKWLLCSPTSNLVIVFGQTRLVDRVDECWCNFAFPCIFSYFCFCPDSCRKFSFLRLFLFLCVLIAENSQNNSYGRFRLSSHHMEVFYHIPFLLQILFTNILISWLLTFLIHKLYVKLFLQWI